MSVHSILCCLLPLSVVRMGVFSHCFSRGSRDPPDLSSISPRIVVHVVVFLLSDLAASRRVVFVSSGACPHPAHFTAGLPGVGEK